MAIQRCPYCKAIIDEGAEYCTNCGTKLLFPEDEFIDEEIPGEKIIDVDEDISGIQQELKEETGKIPPAEEEETPSAEEKEPEEGTSLEAELEDVVPIADVAPVEDDMTEPGEEEAPAEEQKSETEKLVAAIEDELVEPEADEPEKKKAAPKKKTPSRKRKSSRKKPAAKKTKKAAPVKVVEDEEPEPEKPEEPEAPAEPEAAAEELEPAADQLEPVAEEQGQAADVLEPEEATPAAEAEAAAADVLGDIEEGPALEAEAPIAEETDLDAEPQDIQEEVTEEEAEIRDTRRGLTEDLPDGFARAIDEARERSGEPLEEFLPQEIEETLEEEEPVPEILTPEPGTAEEKEWQTPPPVGEPLAEPGTQDEQRIQTGDIEDIVDEAEKEKEEIDDFIASIKKERRSVRDQIKSDTQDIPPWAKNVPDGPLPDIPPTDEIVFNDKVDWDEEEETEAPEQVKAEAVGEEEAAPEEDSSSLVEKDAAEGPVPGYDTRSAFPETVDQQGLPFVKTAEIMGEDIEEDIEEEVAEEAPKPKKIRVKRKSQPVGFSDWIRARIFDVVFVSVLWFVALWIASQVIGISVFRVLSGSTPVALIFLGILLLIYFFFFLYFLGETLGNYLFSSDE